MSLTDFMPTDADIPPSAGRSRAAVVDDFARSELFERTFQDGMALVEETAAYLDGDGRREAKLLSRAAALAYAALVHADDGVLLAVEEIGRACRARGIHFHCDAVQAAGKIDVSVDALGCDTLSISAHKLHAPKGIGALYVRRGATMASLIVGGAQERRRRAGTENVPLAAAFAAAVALPRKPEEIAALRDRFESALSSAVAITVNGAEAPRLPNTSNVTFDGGDGEGIVIGLDLSGVAVSTGSACSSGRIEPSPVLLAMGLTPEEARATVRFSLSRFTTGEEIDTVVGLVTKVTGRK